MQPHQLLDHPLFEDRPIRAILQPFGFEVSIEVTELPIDAAFDDEGDMNCYSNDPRAYIDSLNFQHPAGYTEVSRFETEDDIVSVAVFAQLLLCADSAFAGPSSPLSDGYMAVWRERMRQISTEEFSRERDDQYENGELSAAASAYAAKAIYVSANRENAPSLWPWSPKWWKPSTPRRDLVKAGALILAEIERLDRAEARQAGE